jgi:hypothetical protein
MPLQQLLLVAAAATSATTAIAIPSDSSSTSNGIPGRNACATQLLTDGCLEPGISVSKCDDCARAHHADLERSGCTTKEVVGLCRKRPSPPAAGGAKLILLGNTPGRGGLCLDGSPAGFYYEPSSSANSSDTWMIYLQGGGACYTQEGCVSRSKEALGSSTNWSRTMSSACPNCDDESMAPAFIEGHHVYIKYCTGDTYRGTRTEVSAATWGLHFDGHLNFARIVDELVANYSLRDSSRSRILLWGGSAGGIGTFVNADYLSSRFPQSLVKAAPDAGFFFPSDPLSVPHGCGMPLYYPDWAAGPSSGDDPYDNSVAVLWQSYKHKSCVDSYSQKLGQNSTWFCESISNLYPYIQTPLLVLENMYDTNQIFAQ